MSGGLGKTIDSVVFAPPSRSGGVKSLYEELITKAGKAPKMPAPAEEERAPGLQLVAMRDYVSPPAEPKPI